MVARGLGAGQHEGDAARRVRFSDERLVYRAAGQQPLRLRQCRNTIRYIHRRPAKSPQGRNLCRNRRLPGPHHSRARAPRHIRIEQRVIRHPQRQFHAT